MKYVLLDPTKANTPEGARLLPEPLFDELRPEELVGKKVIEVADDFSWRSHRPDFTDLKVVPSFEPAWADLRYERDRRLSATDWTQLADVPSTTKAKWKAYRKALRDLPAKTADPAAPEWPVSPA